MGTRNLTAVMADGVYKIAQYGQWDGYPDGQGKTALEFCQEHLTSEEGRQSFKKKLDLIRFVSDEELENMWKTFGSFNGLANLDQVDEFDKKWPFFSRDHGAAVLNMVMNANDNILMTNSLSFASYSLFCEWAYVIDLDKNTLEAYRGFNKEPVPKGERFSIFTQTDSYYPIKHLQTWSLDKLPTFEVFKQQLSNKEE